MRHREEESILGTEDDSMADSQDDSDRSPSPHLTAYETPLLEVPDSPVTPNASDFNRRSSVMSEEAEDADSLGRGLDEMEEDTDTGFEFIEDFPAEAGTPYTGRERKTPFEKLKKAQQKENKEPWSPFADEEEWELAKWLMTGGVSQAKLDEYLKLATVSAIV